MVVGHNLRAAWQIELYLDGADQSLVSNDASIGHQRELLRYHIVGDAATRTLLVLRLTRYGALILKRRPIVEVARRKILGLAIRFPFGERRSGQN